MLNNLVICGVTVDPKDYDRFANQRFEVPHDGEDMVTFRNEDGKRSLYQIEFLSKSADYKKYYPEFAEECRKIVERERKNIQSYYAARDGRKGYKVMRHDNFQDYLKDLQEVHKKASEERQSLLTKFNKAKEEWNEAQQDRTLSEYGKTTAKMKWLDAEKDYKEAVADLQKRTKEDVEVVRKEFNEHIEDFYCANGSRMDEGTIRLLNSGIRLADGEIDRLISQNISNPTMLRLICDHCDKNKLKNKTAIIYGAMAKTAGKHETSIFNQVVDMIEKATGADDLSASVWGTEKGNFERLSNEAIGNMAGLAVKPGNGEHYEN